MTDKLEKHIDENRSSFDDLNPPIDMWERISQSTEKNKVGIKKLVVYRLSGAAAILIVALLGYVYFSAPASQKNTVSEYYEEMMETEQFYSKQVLIKKQQVFKLTSDQPEIKSDIEQELALLDTAMTELKNDLNDNIANSEVIEAMIQNYRMKLQILEDILMYLEPDENNDSKSTNKISNI